MHACPVTALISHGGAIAFHVSRSHEGGGGGGGGPCTIILDPPVPAEEHGKESQANTRG